jgi:alkanesulfonate monooxygenase SsuD/methylene tetrahydromethanopterin reductase-like flavin-dependent oxidoreductase (luciferase family)
MTTLPSGAAPVEFPLTFGLDTFGDVTHDEEDRPLSHAQTIRNLVEQGVLADQVGVDFFGIGEHHTNDFPLSAGYVVLGAIAARTSRIHLGSAVTVLSSDDPVRVFQRYSTLDAISSGRAARLGFSLMLAIIGGPPLRFAPFSQLFEKALERFGRPPLPVGVHAPGHVDVTDEQAREAFWPRYREVIRSVSETRGFAIPTRESFLREVEPQGALYVGSPETVAQKIAANLPALGATRFDLKYGMGGLSYEALMTNIELYGTQVVPRVRELLAEAQGRGSPRLDPSTG